MTIKEYNKLRADIYSAAMENQDVADAINGSGIAYIYEITQLPDKHKVLVLTAKTQMNSYVLREHGFDPDRVSVELRLTLHQQTKCADF